MFMVTVTIAVRPAANIDPIITVSAVINALISVIAISTLCTTVSTDLPARSTRHDMQRTSFKTWVTS
jgi:hypothetical protein